MPKGQSRTGINSNEKGARYERKVCGVFSRWCSDDTRDDLFWRSAMSGGRATLHSRTGRKNSSQSGDISAVDTLGAPLIESFFLECKHLESLEIHRWIYNGKTPLDEIWDKTLRDAEFQDKIPLVVAKQNRQPELVMSTELGWQLFFEASGGALTRAATIYRACGTFHVWYLHDLVTRCTYDRLKKAITDRERVRL